MEFGVNKGNKDYTVAAVHFANPWPFIADCLNSKEEAGLKLVYGTHNPTYGQARTIANKYGGEKRTLVIGDTNAPKSIKVNLPWPLPTLNFQSNPYELLVSKLGQSDVSSYAPTAFGTQGNFNIDHAFVSPDLQVPFANIIPFAGSDHSAIYAVIR